MSVEAVGALAEPQRRAVYEFTVSQIGAVTRDEVAQALGIGRTLAAFHLDKLVECGLLSVASTRRSGRNGPGAGRPAKVYRRSRVEYAVSLPPRDYLTPAMLLARAVESTGADAALFQAARERGRQVGLAACGALAEREGEKQDLVADPIEVLGKVLAEAGYEPRVTDGAIELVNCPFHALAQDFAPLACGMNLALMEGLVETAGLLGYTARTAPDADKCCVVIDLPSKNNQR